MSASILATVTWLSALAAGLPASRGVGVQCELRQHLLVCPARIGARLAAVVIDTGTSRSVIDSGLARRLRVSPRHEEITVPGGAVRAGRGEIGDIEFGDTHSGPLVVSICSLAPLVRLLGAKPDGVLGLDVLARTPITMDFRTGQVWVGAATPLSNHVALVATTSGFAAVDGQVVDRQTRLVVDTGLDGVVLLSRKGRDALDRAGDEGGYGLGGPVRLASAGVDCIWIGRTCIDGHSARSVRDPDLATAYGADGLIGPTALSATLLSLDLEQRRMWWETRPK